MVELLKEMLSDFRGLDIKCDPEITDTGVTSQNAAYPLSFQKNPCKAYLSVSAFNWALHKIPDRGDALSFLNLTDKNSLASRVGKSTANNICGVSRRTHNGPVTESEIRIYDVEAIHILETAVADFDLVTDFNLIPSQQPCFFNYVFMHVENKTFIVIGKIKPKENDEPGFDETGVKHVHLCQHFMNKNPDTIPSRSLSGVLVLYPDKKRFAVTPYSGRWFRFVSKGNFRPAFEFSSQGVDDDDIDLRYGEALNALNVVATSRILTQGEYQCSTSECIPTTAEQEEMLGGVSRFRFELAICGLVVTALSAAAGAFLH
jgi:hypothetical protein